MPRTIKITIVSICFLFIFVHTGYAQKKRVAMLPIILDCVPELSGTEESLLNGTLRNSFALNNNYEALTRSDIAGLLEEYRFQASGFVDDQQRVELGGLFGADYICLSKLTKDGNYCYLEASLIDITSGLISSSSSSFFVVKDIDYIGVWEQSMASLVKELIRYDNAPKVDNGLVDITDTEGIPFLLVEKKPSFMGASANNFSYWVNQRLIFPESAKENGIQAKVFLQFTITNEGKLI